MVRHTRYITTLFAATTAVFFIASDAVYAPQAPTTVLEPQSQGLAPDVVLASRSGAPNPPQATPQSPANAEGNKAKEAQPTVLYEGIAELTAYTAQDDAGMNGRGITASGVPAVPYVTAAAWRGIPFGARVEVPELGASYIVQDRGGAIGFAHIDLYVGATNKQGAFDFGRKKLRVRIIAP